MHKTLFLAAMVFCYGILASAQQAVASDTFGHKVGCTSLEHDPAKLSIALNQGHNLEEYRTGKIISSDRLYISDILYPEALAFNLLVPEQPDLYGKEAGESIPYTLLVCYPTHPDNSNADYQVPDTDMIIPRMQSGYESFFIPEDEKYPMLLVSHGLKMDPLDRRIPEVASQGYIVAALFHGDGRFPEATALNLREIQQFSLRPLALSATIDFLLEHPDFGPVIDNTRIGGVGISIGGSALLALMGGKIIGPEFFKTRNTAVDHRLTAAGSIVPYMGRKQLWYSLFGWDNHGANDVHFPYLAFSSTNDSIADIDVVKKVMENKPGPKYLVQIENEDHWVSEDAVDNAFAWILAFLNAHLKGDPSSNELLHLGNSLPSPVENTMVMAHQLDEAYSEKVFDMAEALVPEIFNPPETTRRLDEIIYRYYEDENVYLASYVNELYLLDKTGVYALGPLMFWWSALKNISESQ